MLGGLWDILGGEINARPDLLPNITLGYQIYDTCTVLRRAAEGTMWMLSGGSESIPNYRCYGPSRLAGIIGDSGSTRSILMVSYFSTSPFLSNRNLFPSFFRTIPSDEFQSRGLAQLVKYFGWSWVGLLATDNDYGQIGIQVVKQEIIMSGACVAFAENILTSLLNRNAPHIVQVINKSTVNVVVVLSSDSDFMPVVEELLKQNVTGKIWVASESWSTSALLSKDRFKKILVGTIGFAIHGGQMPGFREYLSSLHPSKHLNNPFAKEFWEQIFSCKWNEEEANATNQRCTGRESLESFIKKADFRITFNVYTCVYTLAWALQSLLQCKLENSIYPPSYAWQKYPSSSTKPYHRVVDPVSELSSRINLLCCMLMGSLLLINQFYFTQVPYSRCNPSCPSGFQKVTIPGKPFCCYECNLCPQGEISNQTDAVECDQCSWDMWPNEVQDRCLPRTIEFLSYTDPMGVSLATIAIISSTIPICIMLVFFCHRTTPIVKANNWSLSCLLLVSLSFCFLCALVFIGYPRPEMCLLRQVGFGMVFSLSISCVLAKTIIVVIAFKATKPGTRLRKWSGIKVSYSVMGFCVLIQLCVCVTWLSFSPPFPELDIRSQSGVIIIICNENSPTAFWCMVGYLGLLAALSFIVAFLARRLPDSFNEAKFITFSMLAFLSVWVSFVPAYLSARGKNTVAMEIFAIISSSWAVVICIFFPKCFIILFRPNMNSREQLMKKDKVYK
uniref:G-protein coupled receptors family 3 profile domain-containing protein n=1 Tax=Leptobrachium leishanense TaxID=445787 RepID=A0A8C5ME89_9ANUR